jgi:hypothetical protein
MRVDPHLAREAARILAAALLQRGTDTDAFALAASGRATPPAAVPGTVRVAVPPELLGLDFTGLLPEGRGHAAYARAAGAHVRYEGPVRPVDIRV